jgi:hypothetical protein
MGGESLLKMEKLSCGGAMLNLSKDAPKGHAGCAKLVVHQPLGASLVCWLETS